MKMLRVMRGTLRFTWCTPWWVPLMMKARSPGCSGTSMTSHVSSLSLVAQYKPRSPLSPLTQYTAAVISLVKVLSDALIIKTQHARNTKAKGSVSDLGVFQAWVAQAPVWSYGAAHCHDPAVSR